MTDNQDKRAGQWGPRQTPNLDPNRQWAALRRRYEWKDTYDDDIAPKDPELETELFGEENHVHTGINFANYSTIKVTVKPEGTKPVETFEEANLHSVMKENVRLAKYTIPTPVQRYSIPIITEGNDLMACAQTGSGKTAAFLIPTLSRLFGKAKKLAAPRPLPGARRFKAEPLVLIIAPTRELATQIFDECRRFTYRSMMRPCVVYGGAEVTPQKNELAKGCDVLTATPGRLNDFLERGIVSLRRVKYLVLDEADRMLDMGFENDIRKIVQKSDLLDDGSRQTLMFSATFPRTIRSLAKDFLADNYVFLTVGRVGGTTSDITQKIVYVDDQNKRNQLVELLLKQPPSRTLIFVETKRGADSLDDYLYNQNFPTTSIHGDRSQREREDALIAFKNGRSPILIATAVAARGLDIKNVMHVINYDLCNDIDEYVHRIGRTARVGNKGLATTFYNERNNEIASDLVKILMECNQAVPDFLQSYKPTDLRFDDDDDDVTTGSNQTNFNYAKNTQDDGGYGNRDKSSNQKPAWDNNPTWDGGKTPWDNNNQAAGNNNNQTAGWDGGKTWDNNPTPTSTWDPSKPSWEVNPPQTQQPPVTSTVQNDWSNAPAAPQQPPYQPFQQPTPPSFQQPPQSYHSPPSQSFQQSQPSFSQGPPQQGPPQGMPQQGMPQHAYSKYDTQPSPLPSQYPQHQFGGAQPVVNLPRQNNQYNATSQQTYGYNTQAPPQAPASYGDYGNNNNPQQNYYNPNLQGNSVPNNDDNNRNQRRVKDEVPNNPAPNSDSWGAPAQPPQIKAWNQSEVPWS